MNILYGVNFQISSIGMQSSLRTYNINLLAKFLRFGLVVACAYEYLLPCAEVGIIIITDYIFKKIIQKKY